MNSPRFFESSSYHVSATKTPSLVPKDQKVLLEGRAGSLVYCKLQGPRSFQASRGKRGFQLGLQLPQTTPVSASSILLFHFKSPKRISSKVGSSFCQERVK